LPVENFTTRKKQKKIVKKLGDMNAEGNKFLNNLELIVIIIGGLSMPVIAFCYYFTTVPRAKRTEFLAILFLIITFVYAVLCFHFSLKALKRSKAWQELKEKNQKEKNK
jgi:hypothetical protein